MRNKDLIAILQQHPDDATVWVHRPTASKIERWFKRGPFMFFAVTRVVITRERVVDKRHDLEQTTTDIYLEGP